MPVAKPRQPRSWEGSVQDGCLQVLREVRAACDLAKPLILVHEIDEIKGGDAHRATPRPPADVLAASVRVGAEHDWSADLRSPRWVGRAAHLPRVAPDETVRFPRSANLAMGLRRPMLTWYHLPSMAVAACGGRARRPPRRLLVVERASADVHRDDEPLRVVRGRSRFLR